MYPARLLATWFGVGLAPRAPGTFGTLAAVPVVLLLWWLAPWWSLPVAGVALAVVGTLAAGVVARRSGVKDPSEVVIDEVAGFVLACSLGRPGWLTLAFAFAIFRVLDVHKPWPLCALERLPGGWGVMADDVAAGLATAALVGAGWALLGGGMPWTS